MASSSRPRASTSNNGQRPSRRTASSYDVRLYEAATPLQHHHRSASSAALTSNRSHIIPDSIPQPPITPSDPHISRLFSTVLGSPFLTTSEPLSQLELPNNHSDSQARYVRPSSPAPTADFSIIDMDIDDQPAIPGSFPSSHSRFLSASMANLSFSRGRSAYDSTWPSNNTTHPNSPSNPFKSLIPRIWDAIMSPSRASAHSPPASPLPSRTSSPRRHANQLWYANNGIVTGSNSPVYWNAGKNKGKYKVGGLFSTRNGSRGDLKNINYSELAPLDGEEGELIDDEACFIDSRAIHGLDILSLLPPELALHILALLTPRSGATTSFTGRSSGQPDSDAHEALCALLACRLVSRKWCRLASDNDTWRALFLGRWNIDLRRAADADMRSPRSMRMTLGKTWDFDLIDVGPKAKRVLGLSTPVIDAPVISAPLQLDWRILYRERLVLERRWAGTQCSPAADDIDTSTRRMGGVYNSTTLSSLLMGTHAHNTEEVAINTGTPYEPKMTKISGHFDSVYCLEFDSRRIITGSRDRTIKIWSLRTGRLLGTLVGAHRGSVLCLKFEKDWDRKWAHDGLSETDENGGEDSLSPGANASPLDVGLTANQEVPQTRGERGVVRSGFMVSGSSDCSVCIWDLHLGAALDQDDGASVDDPKTGNASEEDDREVNGDVRQILRGHVGGVLDLRIDSQWIVSCSKDAVIRVWNRKTLQLHRMLRGHEGPVNAVGLQSGRVVSASGDGKMILWDIGSGERIRTFEGHDRGLACIEFKEDLIVSGSNDCKIKVWSAATGDCLRTLVGHEALVRALSFDPRSGRLVSASYDKSIKLWDLNSGKLVRDFKGTHTSHIFDVKFDSSRIVSTSHDQKITVLDFARDLNAALFV